MFSLAVIFPLKIKTSDRLYKLDSTMYAAEKAVFYHFEARLLSSKSCVSSR